MRPFLFILCFSLGVTLMMLSSAYEPREASALPAAAGPEANDGLVADGEEFQVKHGSPFPARRSPRVTTVSLSPARPSSEPNTTEHAASPDDSSDAAYPASESPDSPEIPERIWRPGRSTTEGDVPLADEDPGDPREPVEPEPESEDDANRPMPRADAGVDQVIWAGAGKVVLGGNASEGVGIRYLWAQTDGPRVTIEQGEMAETIATDLDAHYGLFWEPIDLEFTLTVVDDRGYESTDTVLVRLVGAPDLVIVPAAESNQWSDKYFQELEGVKLPHFEAWIRGPSGGLATFVIDCGSPLSIETLKSADFEMWYSEENGRHLYQFDVYQDNEEPRARLEFFVQTEERIPAVVRLGVDWYGD